eukprot:scaffold117869_cov63-Phaeocystis_antarctica.AAC.5
MNGDGCHAHEHEPLLGRGPRQLARGQLLAPAEAALFHRQHAQPLRGAKRGGCLLYLSRPRRREQTSFHRWGGDTERDRMFLHPNSLSSRDDSDLLTSLHRPP